MEERTSTTFLPFVIVPVLVSLLPVLTFVEGAAGALLLVPGLLVLAAAAPAPRPRQPALQRRVPRVGPALLLAAPPHPLHAPAHLLRVVVGHHAAVVVQTAVGAVEVDAEPAVAVVRGGLPVPRRGGVPREHQHLRGSRARVSARAAVLSAWDLGAQHFYSTFRWILLLSRCLHSERRTESGDRGHVKTYILAEFDRTFWTDKHISQCFTRHFASYAEKSTSSELMCYIILHSKLHKR